MICIIYFFVYIYSFVYKSCMLGNQRRCIAAGCFKLKKITLTDASRRHGRRFRGAAQPPVGAAEGDPEADPASGAEGRTRDDAGSASVPATANPGATRGAGPLARRRGPRAPCSGERAARAALASEISSSYIIGVF